MMGREVIPKLNSNHFLVIFDGQACYDFKVLNKPLFKAKTHQLCFQCYFNCMSTLCTIRSLSIQNTTMQLIGINKVSALESKNCNSQHRLDQVYNIIGSIGKEVKIICMFVVKHVSHSKLVKNLRGEGESLIMGCLLKKRKQLL